jgi:hypothetical protein
MRRPCIYIYTVAVHSIILLSRILQARRTKKERHYAIYVYTLRHAMICQRPEAKNTGEPPPLRSRACVLAGAEYNIYILTRVQIHYAVYRNPPPSHHCDAPAMSLSDSDFSSSFSFRWSGAMQFLNKTDICHRNDTV